MNRSNSDPRPGRPATQWDEFFCRARILSAEPTDTRTGRPRATRIGNFLSRNVGRIVPVEVNGRIGRARLCVVTEGARIQKHYFFEFVWNIPMSPVDPSELEDPGGPEALTTASIDPLDALWPETPATKSSDASSPANGEVWP